MSKQWYYSQDGAQYGPEEEEKVIRLIQSGELYAGSPVCRKGSDDWQPARNHLCFQVEIYPKKKSTAKATAVKVPNLVSEGTSQSRRQLSARPAATAQSPVSGMITCEQITKFYGVVTALAPFDLEVKQGEFIAVKGVSGSGKTTLLLMLGGMLRPTRGTVHFDGVDVYSQPSRVRAEYRATEVGFVFQMFHLVPYLNVAENVQLATCNGSSGNQPNELLERFGLGHRLTHTPSELSAGERQRVALARALVNEPRLILADEPTGNLDPENDRQVFEYLSEFHRAGGTVIVVTHGSTADEFADRIVNLKTAG